ncbi:MAG: ECF transporter S component [Clostridiales bacterium]|nr:ECF transporter S component [Clostridiales bacterium]
MKKDRFNIRHTVLAALFAALAYVATLVLHIKVAGFLTFDAKDAVICFAGMLLGPGWSAAITLVVATVEMTSLSETAFLGWIMNVVSSLAFSLTGCIFYRRFRKFWSAIAGLGLSVLCQTSVMMVMNLLITPIYTGMSAAEVPKLLLPFNLLKSLLNASLVMAIYKPLSVALKRSGIMGREEGEGAKEEKPRISAGRTALVIISALAVAAACVAILILVMNGQFSWK